MVQQVTYIQGEWNSRHAMNSSGQVTSMVHIIIKDSSQVFQFKILSGAPEWMDSLTGEPDRMDFECRMLATPINNTLFGSKNCGLVKADAHRIEPDAPEPDTAEPDAPDANSQH